MAEEVVQILLRVKSHMIWQIIISYGEALLEPDDCHSLQSTVHQKDKTNQINTDGRLSPANLSI